MNEFLWVEKYRPNTTIEECVLPDRLKILSRKLFAARNPEHAFVYCGYW